MESVILDYNLAQEERYLEIFITPSEIGPNVKKIILLKLKEKCLNKEIQGTMITNIEMIDINNIPLSKTTSNKIEFIVLVKLVYKIYKPDYIINGDLFSNVDERRAFVISKNKICEIVNRDCVEKDKITNISVRIFKYKKYCWLFIFSHRRYFTSMVKFIITLITSFIIEST